VSFWKLEDIRHITVAGIVSPLGFATRLQANEYNLFLRRVGIQGNCASNGQSVMILMIGATLWPPCAQDNFSVPTEAESSVMISISTIVMLLFTDCYNCIQS
jgi:hypothetical protein